MRQLFQVVHYPIFGGPHNQALRLDGPLRRRGWNTVVVVPDEQGNAVERLRAGGVEVVPTALHRLRATRDVRTQLRFASSFWPEVRALRRLIRERDIEVVVIGGLVNPHAAVAARLEGVPVVWQLLDTRAPMALRRALMPAVRRLSGTVMSTGIEVARVHPGALGLGPRLVPFFPPVDTSRFRPDAERRLAARAELGLPAEAYAVGTVGNVNPQKGHEYLVRAAGHLRARRNDVYFRVLGATTPTHLDYQASLHDEARALGLDGGGVFEIADPGSRVDELLPAFDVFALTSVPLSEGIPTVILEAMACGIPVVVTDVGSVREAVEEGVTGYVVPPLEPAAVANAIEVLLDNAELRDRMGRAARGRAVERYDVEVCADVHVHAFEVALAQGARR